MKTFNVRAFNHVNELIKELSILANFNTEKHAHAIAEKVIDMLNELPNEGNQSEIEAANRMVRAYRYPVPTRPSTPENVEMEPIPIPAPKPTLPRGKEPSNNSPTKQTRKISHLLAHHPPTTLPTGTCQH
jgi:hypothetical protein